MFDFIPVAKVSAVPDPGKQLIEVGDRVALLVHVGGRFYCIDDVCTHDGGPLGEGELDGYELACPRHGAKFDVRDGRALTMPATEATTVHEVKIVGDDVCVRINLPLSEDAVREELSKVLDPEFGVSIVDLGLIYAVDLAPGDGAEANVAIEMTMTSPACPSAPEIIAAARHYVKKLEGVGEVEIKIVMDPPWTPDRMTEEARDELGFF